MIHQCGTYGGNVEERKVLELKILWLGFSCTVTVCCCMLSYCVLFKETDLLQSSA